MVIPKDFESLFTGVKAEDFRVDICSTDIREKNPNYKLKCIII